MDGLTREGVEDRCHNYRTEQMLAETEQPPRPRQHAFDALNAIKQTKKGKEKKKKEKKKRKVEAPPRDKDKKKRNSGASSSATTRT